MCQEIHLADVRLALRDYCEQRLDDEVTVRVDEVLAVLEDGEDDMQDHAMDHRRRARRLAAAGDNASAAIHQALLTNIERAR